MAKDHLTPKQKRFVEEYLVDLNATQAALRAGYPPRSARQVGSENLSKPDIQNFIAAAQAQSADRLALTQDYVLAKLKAEVERPPDETTPSARVRTLELLGKHLGMFKDQDPKDQDSPEPAPMNSGYKLSPEVQALLDSESHQGSSTLKPDEPHFLPRLWHPPRTRPRTPDRP